MFLLSRQKTEWKRRKKQNNRRTQARTSAKNQIIWSCGSCRWGDGGAEAQDAGDRDAYLWRVQTRSREEFDIK